MRIDRSRKTMRVLAVVAAASVALAACSSQGGAQNQAPAAGAAAAATGRRRAYTIAMVTHERPVTRSGTGSGTVPRTPPSAHGIDLKYSNNQDGPEQATLVQNAIDSKVDGLAVTLPSPERSARSSRRRLDAGIPIVAFNAGIDAVQGGRREDVLRLGRDARRADRRAEDHRQDGGGKTLCVIQEQG